jgi:hypothetical protein
VSVIVSEGDVANVSEEYAACIAEVAETVCISETSRTL